MREPITFAGGRLDRAGDRRGDAAWLAGLRAAALFLPVWRTRPLVAAGRAGLLPWQPALEGGTCVFLGLEGTRGIFAVDVPGEVPPPLPGEFTEMRPAAALLPGPDAALAGLAKALLDWHARHGFCANCGRRTEMADGGWRRLCPACGAEHFPRTDPVVIMLPVFGDRCLLGRNARFVNGLWSAFAGFVEPGESLEEAVVRELREEVRLEVGAVRYHRSQPWPFPSSLMLGCYAEARSEDFVIDGVEIAEARWLHKDEVRARLAGRIEDGLRLPQPIAIARHLLMDWVEG